MEITPDKKKLLSMLYSNSRITNEKLGEIIGKNRITVGQYLKSLNEENDPYYDKTTLFHPNRKDNRIFFIEIKTNPEEPTIVSKLQSIFDTKSIDGIIGNTSLMVKFQVEKNEDIPQVLRKVDSIIANTRFQYYRLINVLTVFKEAGHVFSDDLNEKFSTIILFPSFIPFTDYPLKWYLQLKPKNLTEYTEIAEEILAPRKEIINLYRTGQEFGLFAVVRTKSKEEYREFIQILYSTEKFQDSHTIFVLDERMSSTFRPFRTE
jgi:DNA-binding Lrp family transcriptional regulator